MSVSDYIQRERLRDQVDALKADLALANAEKAALREKRGHLAHAMWVAYQMGAGLPYNAEPTPAQLKSQDDGWKAFDANPSLTPEMNHENWMRYKLADGWVCGPVKDEAAQTHPDLVPYDDLPEIERRKDDMDVYARQTIAALLADPRPAAERLLRDAEQMRKALRYIGFNREPMANPEEWLRSVARDALADMEANRG